MTQRVDEISQNFNLVWLPPSASAEGGDAVGGSNVGYHPRQWNNQNSCWGTASDLRTLISAMHAKGVKVIADIVINHRAATSLPPTTYVPTMKSIQIKVQEHGMVRLRGLMIRARIGMAHAT